MKDLYLLNYNNYYNRTIKPSPTLEEAEQYLVGDIVQNINFNPSDGVYTTQIINSNYEFTGTPDYCLVVDTLGDHIESTWFVLEAKRLRTGQWELSLKRDSLENLVGIMDSKDTFIAKGYVNKDNSAIFNSEQINFNQIKESETFLKDYTKCPWIVGYISPDVAKDNKTPIEVDVEGYYDLEYLTLSDYPFYQYTESQFYLPRTTYINGYFEIEPENWVNFKLNLDKTLVSKGVPYQDRPASWSCTVPFRDKTKAVDYLNTCWTGIPDKEISAMITELGEYNVISNPNLENLLRLQNGKIIKVKNQFYEVKYETYNPEEIMSGFTIGSANDRSIQACFSKYFNTKIKNPNYSGQKFSAGELKAFGTAYRLVISPLSGASAKLKIDFTNKDVSNPETPYGILCMPYSDNYTITSTDGKIEPRTLSKTSRIKLFQALGSIQGLLYDIQLVPYCPITNLSISNDIINLQETNGARSIPVTSGPDNTYNTSFMVAPKSSFSFNITNPIDIPDIKIANETEKWRLCSPNYAGVFEFNAAKFYDGFKQTITNWNVDCTYKPYNPYIHVAPEFKGLYGKDFGDSRGLICGGDFSIDRISDNWETYQYNNKNFQLQFDRQVESMELQRNWNMKSSAIGGVGHTVGGSAAGYLVGGPVGAAVGAATGAIDATYNTIEAYQLGKDRIDAAKDQHRYGLENIQAQPYGLTKVSALNKNNKLFPFIEHYVATEEEVEDLKQKLKYEGMTVMRYGSIRDYLGPDEFTFIKGRFIRFPETLKEDTHILEDANNELQKGVYIYAN